MDFVGKVAIVTGGSSGIGKAFSSVLLDAGMRVCICDINSELGEEFMKSLPETQKKNALFLKCDVTSFTNFKDAFEKVLCHLGRIDVVVNNAGILDEHNWKKMVDVNFIGVIHGIQLAFEYMDIRKSGHGGVVINTSSTSGLEPAVLNPVYGGCKHAVVGLTRSYGAAYHFDRTGIKVSAVCPGATDTPLYHSFPKQTLDEELSNEYYKVVTPIKTEEIAKALIQILQEGKNGAVLRIDENGTRYV